MSCHVVLLYSLVLLHVEYRVHRVIGVPSSKEEIPRLKEEEKEEKGKLDKIYACLYSDCERNWCLFFSEVQ